MANREDHEVSDTSWRDPAPWPIYEANRDRLIALLRPLDAEIVGSPVALTPGWTIAEVLAHVCGLNADIASGMRTGLGTPERTRHQVSVRAGDSLDAVCDEWLSHADAMRKAMDDDPFLGHRLTADLTIHLHDVQHSVGAAVDRDDLATRCAAHTYGRVVADLLVERCGVPLRIELLDGTAFEPAGTETIDLTLRASPFDWLRTATGRRSVAEARSLDWSDDPSTVLDHLCPYGPLRDTDAGF